MSGIYGYVEKVPANNRKRLEALDFWHKEYGREGRIEKQFPFAALGSRINCIKMDCQRDMEVLCEKERYYAVFDALIYNREELIKHLLVYGLEENKLKIMSDEKLLFYIYLHEDETGLRHVNGDFSGVIYDTKDNVLTVFRDHLGVRPLYIYEDDKVFAFATDYRGLLAMPEADVSLNEGYFYGKMCGYSMKDVEQTYFQHISAVAPAHVISFCGNSFQRKKRRYWRLGEKKIRFSSEKEYISELRDLVKDAIERRLQVSSSLVGGELSGGLDSTVIDVLIRKFDRTAFFCSLSPDIDTVPLQEHDERKNIIEICQKFDMQCHFMTIKWHEEERIINGLQQVLPADGGQDVMEEIMQYFKGKGASLVFSGWGGDEGVSHRANPMELWESKEYGAYFEFWWENANGEKLRCLRVLKRIIKNLLELNQKKKIWDCYTANGVEKTNFINKKFAERAIMEIERTPLYFSYNPRKHIENGGNRHRTEAVAVYSARHGIQYLFPFLDYRVEDYAVSIPRRLFLKGKQNRYIYREAFREDMTEELYHYQRKNEPVYGKYVYQNMSKRFRILSDFVLMNLDRKYWAKYLDFEEVEKIIKKEKKGEIEYAAIFPLMRCLTDCYRIQLLQTKTSEEVLKQ